jgi:hypothetical protein
MKVRKIIHLMLFQMNSAGSQSEEYGFKNTWMKSDGFYR